MEKLKQSIKTVTDWAISRLPDKAQVFLVPYGLFVLTYLGLRWIPVVLLRGRTTESGQSGSLLVAGHEPWVGYLPGRFFVEEPQREWIGHVTARQLPALLNRLRASVDLVLVRVDRLSAQKFFEKDYLRVPEWIGMQLKVPDDLDALVCANRSIREDMRLARRHKLHMHVTEGEEEFREFYDSMYLPFSQVRHGAMAFVKSRSDLRRRLRTGGILWIKKENQTLAGVLFACKHGMLDLQAIGLARGALPLKIRGIMAALYYFSIAHARQLRCTAVDFRGARPSLHDGLLRYKRKWGNVLYDKPDTYYDWLIHWNVVNGVVKHFLSHTGLIFREEGHFSAIHSDESQSCQSLWIEGLHHLYLQTEAGRHPMQDKDTSLKLAGAGHHSLPAGRTAQ